MMRYGLCLAVLTILSVAGADELPPGVRNTQPAGERPVSPAEAVRKITVPEGFAVTLFAGEPDVRQPIAFTFDDRGRLWVVECYSYPEWNADEGRDRVVILEDTDGDGRFDERKVFLDNGVNLTGIAWGFGGVWLCSAPNLILVPDRDLDDTPDGPPVVLLDGWNWEKAKHNIFNGLTWGPDGWLYGCHGILAESVVGVPGTPADRRTRINRGIWRYHPVTRAFEVVCRGTTNPWGIDFDDYGQGFFANCVIEHMWQAIPGARFKRMYGQDDSPYTYLSMGPVSDHLHWAGDDWNTAGSDGRLQTSLGGGHAHCGTMVYLGDNFPAEYRNSVFTHNIHGNRVNRDLLVPEGSGYKATHGPDFMTVHDPWFRGVAIAYGPDGGVYSTDWNDSGECHDEDGVYRSSGRIYKITYGKPAHKRIDLTRADERRLADLHLEPNDWYVRRARRILQERAAGGEELRDAKAALNAIVRTHKDVTRRLRALWSLHTIGALDERQLAALLDDKDEYLRAWGVRMELEDQEASRPTLSRMESMAASDPSPRVRLELASGLQRLPVRERWTLAQNLAARADDASDPNIPLMTWYALEPAVASDRERGVALIEGSRMPVLRQLAARRVIEAEPAAGAAALAQLLGRAGGEDVRLDVMRGMLEGLRGRQLQTPPGWSAVYHTLAADAHPEVRSQARLLALALGDGNVASELRRIVADTAAAADARTEALAALIDQKDPRLPEVLLNSIADGRIGGAALRGLAAYDHPDTPRIVLEHYERLDGPRKLDALATLASRPAYASALLDAMERRTVDPGEVPAFIARQIHGLDDQTLRERLSRAWGVVNTTPEDKRLLMARFKAMLTPEALAKANPRAGRAVFQRTCASCHKLFGEGRDLGPDLTGSDRANLDYILINTLDPSATVGRGHQLTTVTTKDGRSLSGVLAAQNDATVTLATATEQLVLPRDGIAALATLPVSMMPEGLLQTLTETEVRDLAAYLASSLQVDADETRK